MDLKNKRILGISQMLLCAGMLILYTKIGAMGMVYVAVSMELFYGITYLFLGGVPKAMSYMVQSCDKKDAYKEPAQVVRAGILYSVLATIIIEGLLYLANHMLIYPSELMFVDSLLELLMITVPFLALLQWIRGVMQSVFQPQITGFSALIFCIVMMLGTWISGLSLDDYGSKAASLMQSVKLKHFYVIIGLVPGILAGALAAILFLAIIGLVHRDEINILSSQPGRKKQNFMKLCLRIFTTQLSEVLASVLKRIPTIVLLWLSIKEVYVENYLVGHFYGAVLPVYALFWNVFDTALVPYKKRLYVSFRKKQEEQFYKDCKTVLCYVFIHSMLLFVCAFALPKSYLAIWSLQTSASFMALMKAGAVIALLGLPAMVLLDMLQCRGLGAETVTAVFCGTVSALAAAAICNRSAGAGILLYVVSSSVGYGVTIIMAAWILSSRIGIHYLSVFLRVAKTLIFCLLTGLLLFVVQTLIFTALGGLSTLVICLFIGYTMLWISIFFFHVFSKEELLMLPLGFLTKAFIRISK